MTMTHPMHYHVNHWLVAFSTPSGVRAGYALRWTDFKGKRVFDFNDSNGRIFRGVPASSILRS